MGNLESKAAVKGRQMGTGRLVGTLLVAGGTLLLLDNLDILPFRVAGLFWPLVLGAWGLLRLTRPRSVAATVWAVTAILAGVLLALGNFGVIRSGPDTLWPLALIAAGVVMLLYRSQWAGLSATWSLQVGSQTRSGTTADSIEEYALFSSARRRILSQNFEGGEATSVFGGIDIDLRNARISSLGREALIEASTAFGSIDIRVPETWRVILLGTAVFGAYEDKTIPPRPEPGAEMPTLFIRGGTAFGAVTVKN